MRYIRCAPSTYSTASSQFFSFMLLRGSSIRDRVMTKTKTKTKSVVEAEAAMVMVDG
jgi:hypothetical protein